MQYLKLISLFGLALICQSVFADGEGLYLGGAFGNASIDGKLDDTANFEKIDFNSDDTGYKLFGILRFGALAVEGGYIDFGNPSANVQDKNLSVKVNGWDVFGVVNLRLGFIDLFGKGGLFLWDSDSHVGSVDAGSDNGTDPAYGVGAAVNLGSLSIRAEWEKFDINNLDSVTMYSLGVAIKL